MKLTTVLYSTAFLIISTGMSLLITHDCMADTELMINVDAFDNLAVADRFGLEYYGPEQIAEFFKNCKENGISTVYWRCTSQISSYRSKLNYNCGMQNSIRSKPDSRRHTGAFSAKVGVIDRVGGLEQNISLPEYGRYAFSAWVSCPDDSNVFLCVRDRVSGRVIAQTSDYSENNGEFKKMELEFSSDSSVRLCITASAIDEFFNFVIDDVSVTDASGNEYVKNGSMELAYRLVPADWDSSSANYVTLNGDIFALDPESQKKYFPNIKQYVRLQKHYVNTRKNMAEALAKYDPLETAVREAHKNNIKIYGWLDPLDEGRRFIPSFGNYWASRFMEENPKYRLVDKQGFRRWGMLCFGYKDVRDYKVALVNEMLDYGVDGIYLKTAHQHNQIWDGNRYEYQHFVYNDVALEEYHKRWGKPDEGKYDLQRLRDIQGYFFYKCVEDIANTVHQRGKKLCLSMNPANTLEPKSGGWPLNWKKMVRENLLDQLLLEPRHGAGHKGYIQSLNNAFGFVDICRKSKVDLGFDFYLNALSEKRVQGQLAKDNPYRYFTEEIVEIAKGPVDFIGIYEGMYVDLQKYWTAVKKASYRISQIEDNEKNYCYSSNASPENQKANLASASNGAIATLISSNEKMSAELVCDGHISNANPLTCIGIPFTVEIELPGPAEIKTIRIFAGTTSNAHNPSGECGIRAYRLLGRNETGNWHPIGKVVTDAPRFTETNSVTEFDYFYDQDLGSAIELSAIRVVVEKSSDTGLRLHCRTTPCVPKNKRVVNIREIQLFGTD